MTTKMRYADNCDFGDLNASKSKYMMTYDHSSGEFVLKDIDAFLPSTTSPLPSKFLERVVDEIDIDNLKFGAVDGGTFI